MRKYQNSNNLVQRIISELSDPIRQSFYRFRPNNLHATFLEILEDAKIELRLDRARFGVEEGLRP